MIANPLLPAILPVSVIAPILHALLVCMTSARKIVLLPAALVLQAVAKVLPVTVILLPLHLPKVQALLIVPAKILTTSGE